MRRFMDLSGYWDGHLELNPDIDVAAPPVIRQPFYVPFPWNKQIEHLRSEGPETEMSGIVRPLQNQNFRDIQRKFNEGTLSIRRTVTTKPDPELPRVFLVFEGSNYRTAAHINGKEAGIHEGGHLGFEFEITDVVEDGENTLEITVDNLRRKNACPQEQFNWQNFGGVYRPCRIEWRSAHFIRRVRLTPRLDSEGWSVHAHVDVSDPTVGDLSIMLESGESTITRKAAIDGPSLDMELPLSNPLVWVPGKGGMSRAVVTLQHGDVEDRLEIPFGVRTVEIDGRRISVNGRPIRLLGAALHEQHAAFGNAVPAWQSDADVRLAQYAGLNTLRVAHYPHAQSLYDACDRNGMLAVAELPCWQFNADHFQSPHALAVATRMADEMTEQLGNHPSIVGWMIQNESRTFEEGAEAFFSAVNETFKTRDPSRLTFSAEHAQPPEHLAVVKEVKGTPSGDPPPTASIPDVLGLNNYAGWYAEKSEYLPRLLDHVRARITDRPIVLSEFGAEGIPGERSLTMEPWTEDYQAALLCSHIRAVLHREDIAGFFIWLFADYECASIGIRAINAKGLVGPDRKPKKAFDAVRTLLMDMTAQ